MWPKNFSGTALKRKFRYDIIAVKKITIMMIIMNKNY